MKSPIVVYDACIFYSALLRDLFVRLADTGFFRARWSVEIHADFPVKALAEHNVLAQHPDTFLLEILVITPGIVVGAVANARAALKNQSERQQST